jgi:hypothetical protein
MRGDSIPALDVQSSLSRQKVLMNRLVQALILLPLAIAVVQTNAGLAQKEEEDTCAGRIYEAKEVTRRAKIR